MKNWPSNSKMKSAANTKKMSGKASQNQAPNQSEVVAMIGAFNSGQLEKALQLALSMTTRYPSQQVGWKCLGAVLHQSGRHQDSLKAMKKSVELAPNDVEAKCNLGVALRDLGRTAEAEQVYRQAIEINPGYAQAHNNLGNSLRDMGRFDEALASYLQAVGLKNDYAEAHNNLGSILKELGRFVEAEVSYRNAIAIKNAYPEALANLGNLLKERGLLEQAADCYRQAIAIKPDFAEALNNLGATLQESGSSEEAANVYRQAILLKPDYAEAYSNLSVVLRVLGQLSEAELSCRQAIALQPNYAEAHSNLGTVLKDLGRSMEAEASCRQSIALNPQLAQTHNNLGSVLNELGRLEEEEACYRQAIVLKPDYAEAHSNLGKALKDLGRLTEAQASCCQAIALNPDFAGAHNNLGNVLRELRQLDEAETSYRRAIALDPKLAEAQNNLGVILLEIGHPAEAEARCRRAIELKPEHVEAHNNLGNALKELGRLDDAEVIFHQAIVLNPEYVPAYNNLLFSMNYVGKFTHAERLQEAKRFGLRASNKAVSKFTDWQCTNTCSKLSIGFVSGDLRGHPVGYFLEGLLTNIDLSKFELIAYPTQFAEDALTQKIKPFFKHWRALFGKNDEAAAKLIHEDAPHILIDLAGHTAHNRLPVFAYKPAPIQVSWLGYFASTGLPEMDYILGDPYVTPETEAHHFSEKIWRLPETYLCFTPPQFEIEVKPLPALVNGFITFGCFNNLTKLNDSVLALWAKVLAVLPNAKLFLKTKQLADPLVVQNMLQRFDRVGVTADRLILEGPSPRADYFESYNKVDIALDPFPFPGGTTSVEGLWMGVPVVTLKGERFISHNGETIAHNAWQANWIANDANDYVRLALEAASDLEKLARERAWLREQVLASPLFDAPRFARNFEAALLAMAAK